MLSSKALTAHYIFACIVVLTAVIGSSPSLADDDYDCMVYICRNDYLNPIPRDRWNDDDYICDNGGLICESYAIPGAPPECPPVKVCFFHSRGYWRNTYRCIPFYELGPYPPCPNDTVSHEITNFLHVGESTGTLAESLAETGFGQRRGIVCIDEPVGPALYDCTIPEWFMDLINEMIEDWEQNGYVEFNPVWFECTEEGCVRHSSSTT